MWGDEITRGQGLANKNPLAGQFDRAANPLKLPEMHPICFRSLASRTTLTARVEGRLMTTAPAYDSRRDRLMVRGQLCSLALHALICLWLWRAPTIAPHLVATRPALPIDLVMMAQDSDQPAASRSASLAQQKAAETAHHPDPRAIPPPIEGQAVDPLAVKLRRLAQLQQPATLPPAPNAQDGVGLSNVTAALASGTGAAAYGVKDYVRAQIERRWVVPETALQRNDWVVRLRLEFAAAGRIARVEIIEDPRMVSDAGFRDFALSVRNAALLASPIALPERGDGLPAELVLEFNPRRVQQ
jgi:hypothetical protein